MEVKIDKLAERRLWAFIRGRTVEVGGMGYARLTGTESIAWESTFLIPQEVSASEVDFETTGGDTFAVERAIADGVLDADDFLWVSWHSHHTMDVYWSGTDKSRIAAFADVGIKRVLSFVGNHAGKYMMRLDVFDVHAHGVEFGSVTMDNLTLTREPSVASEFDAAIKSELDENVKPKKYTGSTYTTKSKDSKSGIESKSGRLSPSWSDEWRAFYNGLTKSERVEARRILSELQDDGYTADDAEELLIQLGLDNAETLLSVPLHERYTEDVLTADIEVADALLLESGSEA